MLHRGLTGPNSRGLIVVTAGDDTVCTDADTWYTILSTFEGQSLIDCTVSEAGLFTYTGPVPKVFDVSGVFNVSVDKACTIKIGSKINGVNSLDGVPSIFPAQSPNGNAIQFGMPTLNPGDNFLPIIQSDVANTTITTITSFGKFWGEYL